jgi:hypothetical protein
VLTQVERMARTSERWALPRRNVLVDSSALLRAGFAACGGYGRVLALWRADVFEICVDGGRSRKPCDPRGDKR